MQEYARANRMSAILLRLLGRRHTDDTHIGKNGKDTSPAKPTDGSPALIYPSRGMVDEGSYEFEYQCTRNLHNGHGTHTQAL